MAKDQQQEKILEVKNLRISFKIDTGTVKAVRGVSFDLYRGRTLCIVGESGSGKSVTSRAILGILADNKIVEGGEILYDGKDLLTLNEDQFTKIRGSKISMIFQDPLSSLNPIMKVGKQLTEPMFLKAKFAKREAKGYLRQLDGAIARLNREGAASFPKSLETKMEAEVLECLAYEDQLQRYTLLANKLKKSEQTLAEKDLHTKKEIWDSQLYTKYRKARPLSEPAAFTATKALTPEEASQVISSLENMIGASHKQMIGALQSLKEELTKIQSSYLAEETAFDLAALSQEEKTIRSEVLAARFPFRMDEDDIIEVFPTSFHKYLQGYRMALKNQADFAKYEAKMKNPDGSVKEMSAKERAHRPEKVATPDEVKESIRGLFAGAVEHLDALLAASFDVHAYAASFYTYWKNMIRTSKRQVSNAEAEAKALELLKQVGIPDPERRFNQYPFEFSGGMRQRIVIAIALSSNPEILICDEPTTALDVTIQSQILELINKLKKELNLSIIFITHDLGVVANMADDIAVMYAGKIVEYGTVYDIFYEPKHPYTWALLASMPDLQTKEKLEAIPGTPPDMLIPPIGDAFAPRNKYAMAIDYKKEPPLFKVSDTHYAATWLLLPDAPKVEMPKIVSERIKRASKQKGFKL